MAFGTVGIGGVMTYRDGHDEVRRGLPELWPRLWRYCLTITGNPDHANDAAQAACIRALERSDGFETGSRLDAWVFRIAQRLWLNDMRAQAVRRGNGLATLDDMDLPDTRPDGERALYSRQIMAEMMRLPEAQRVTVLLVYIEGYSYREAAGVLEIPIGTVMSRLAAARKTLSKALHEEGAL